jgi:hypothetical protein
MHTNDDCWSNAVFRVISKKKSIEDISAVLNASPTRFFVKGEFCSKRNPKSKIREENVWIFESKLSEQELPQSHIEKLLSFLKENTDSIRELQQECEFAIICAYSSGSGQGGFTLEHDILKELTSYPVDLSIDLYPPGENFLI